MNIRQLTLIFLLAAVGFTALVACESFGAAATSEASSIKSCSDLNSGITYSSLIEKLRNDGWQVNKGDGSYNQHPEISCGSGLDAVCETVFTKGNAYLEILIKAVKNGELIVDGCL